MFILYVLSTVYLISFGQLMNTTRKMWFSEDDHILHDIRDYLISVNIELFIGRFDFRNLRDCRNDSHVRYNKTIKKITQNSTFM